MPKTPVPDELILIEETLWHNDASIYDTRLQDDAVLIFAETGPIGKEEALRAIEKENAEGRHWAEVEMHDVAVTRPRPDVSLLRYRARARWADDAREHHLLATSLYVRQESDWRLVFHQQTPVPSSEMQPAGSSSRGSLVRHQAAGAMAIGATALGALAVGALAIGAFAMGRVAVGALTLKNAHIRSLTIDDLLVGRLRVMESQI